MKDKVEVLNELTTSIGHRVVVVNRISILEVCGYDQFGDLNGRSFQMFTVLFRLETEQRM